MGGQKEKNGTYSLIPYRRGDKWGYVTPDRKPVIDPVYDLLISKYSTDIPLPVRLSEKYILVRKDGKLGFIDTAGNVVSPFIYKLSQCKTGGPVSPFAYTPHLHDSDGPIAVQKGTKWGFTNEKGDVLIQPQYDDVVNFSDGLAAVKIGDKWGAVNTAGELMIQAHFCDPFFFENGLTMARHEKSGSSLYNKKGEKQFDLPGYVYDTIAKGLYSYRKNAKFGLIDSKGEIAVPCAYDWIFEADEMGWIKVRKNDKTGFISIDQPVPEALRFPTKFVAIFGFSDGISRVKTDSISHAWVDRAGNQLVPGVYAQVNDFHEGLAGYTNQRYGVVIIKGRKEIPHA